MSSLQGQLSIDLSVGFEWHAVLTLSPQVPEGQHVVFKDDGHSGDRNVIFEAGRSSGGPKFTVCLNYDKLLLALTDLDGKEHLSPPVPTGELTRLAHIGCAAGPTGKGTTRLLVMVNNVVRAEREVRANFGGVTSAKSSIGSDLKGGHPAAFVLGELLVYGKLLSDPERSQLHAYLGGKHGLGAQT